MYPDVLRLMLNGLGVYTTWCVIASLLNLTAALVYVGGVDQRAACLAFLSLLVICHTTWFIVENFLVDKYARCAWGHTAQCQKLKAYNS